MHGADWCEAAGQSEPITTRLKNLLKVGGKCNHPCILPGCQIFSLLAYYTVAKYIYNIPV